MTNATSASQSGAFAHHFERRADFVFGNFVPGVVNATVRERTVGDLRVFRIADVFAGEDKVFLGFGVPNVYLAVPGEQGGYIKFAGKSLKRAPSVIEETRGFVQSGYQILFQGLPEHAAEKLRIAMARHNGIKYWTCVNANCRVLEDAGFALAGTSRKLSSIYFPYALAKQLRLHGLTFEGQPVELTLVRTTTMDLEEYARTVIAAEFMTFCRHGQRNLEAKAKVSRLWKGVAAAVHAPAAVYRHFVPAAPPAPLVREIAPALPGDVAYEDGFRVKASMPSKVGLLLRQFVGPHTLTEVRQERVAATDFLSRHLQPFPQPNPGFVTRLKKRFLFSRPMIALLRFLMASKYAELGDATERDLYDMLRTDSAKKRNIYNFVVTNKRIVVVRTSVRMRLIDWVLSKHLVASGYLDNPRSAAGEGDEFVLCAGEVRKATVKVAELKGKVALLENAEDDVVGAIIINGNSGTYQPSDEEVVKAGEFLQKVLPHVPVVVEVGTHD